MDNYELPHINTALSVGTDVTDAQTLRANQEPKCVFVGQYPFNEGFLLAPDEAARMIQANARNREVIFPYMIGRDLTSSAGPARWIIDSVSQSFGKSSEGFRR